MTALNANGLRSLRAVMLIAAIIAFAAQPALAQQGSVLTSLQSQITTAARAVCI